MKTITTVKEFTDLFDSDEDFRNGLLEVVDSDVIDLNDADGDILSWKDLVEFLDCEGFKVDASSVQGVNTGDFSVFPLPEYGWDGGNAITTVVVNVTCLVDTNIFRGPMASIVRRTDPTKPGVAIHEYDSRILFQIL